MAAGVSCHAKERPTRASKGLGMKMGGPRSKTDRDLWKETRVEMGGLQVSMPQWVVTYVSRVR